MTNKIRVLIVDDSSVIRSLLTQIINTDDTFEVVGAAPNPYIARQMLVDLNPVFRRRVEIVHAQKRLKTMRAELARRYRLKSRDRVASFYKTSTVNTCRVSQEKELRISFRRRCRNDFGAVRWLVIQGQMQVLRKYYYPKRTPS